MFSSIVAGTVIALSITAPTSINDNKPTDPNFNTMRFDTPLTQSCKYALRHTSNIYYNPEGIWHGCYDKSRPDFPIVIDEKGNFIPMDAATLHYYRVIYKKIHYDITSIHATEKGYRDAVTAYSDNKK